MTSRALLLIYILTATAAVLISSYYREYSEKKSLQLFKRNANCSLCSLCLGNDSFCDSLDFQLDYKWYLSQHSSYLYLIIALMMRLFNLLIDRQNDQVFFGTLRLDNGSFVPAVAKSPGYFNSEMFEQTVNRSIDISTIITDDQWQLLPFSMDRRSLVVCSKYDINSTLLLRRFFSSVVNNDIRNNLQPWVEAWTAAHLSVELLILKVSSNYLKKTFIHVCL